MATTNAELTRDKPEAYIARDRRRALGARQPMADRVRGAACADIRLHAADRGAGL